MKKFVLIFTPEHDQKSIVAKAITAAQDQQGKQVLEYHHNLPTSSSEIEVATLSPKHPQAHTGALLITLCPPEVLPGGKSFSSYLGAGGVEAALPGIRCALQGFLQLDHQHVLTVALNNFTVVRATAEFLFEAESEAQATQLLLGLAHHCKVVMDFPFPMPNKKWLSPKKSLTRVNWSSDSARTVEMALSFANARAFIMSESRSLPPKLLDSDDDVERLEKLSYLRRLLCVEIDAEMALATEGADPSFRLPLQLDKWAPRAMNRNPDEFVWDAFAWETWLNLDLPSADDDIDVTAAGLSEEQEELLRAYLNGAALQTHPSINREHDRFLAFRRALILKAKVDLLNPWRFFRWNSSATLRPILIFSNQLKGEDSRVLADFTLTKEAAGDATSALEAALKDDCGRGNWR
jgi:hypothetical protein